MSEPKPSYVLNGADCAAPRLMPGLYLVSTPIGHLKDISLRALETLAAADVILCEDTRVTRKLTARYGIKPPLRAYHEHNADRVRASVLARLAAGEALALVSDAGTPLVSDPGFKLVRAAREDGHEVTAIPGPSAPITALTLSGLPVGTFCFAGFLPNKHVARCAALEKLASIPATLIFFESAKRLAASLADMAAVFGPRPACIARELTKMHEEIRRADLEALAAHYAQQGAPKGEIVIVVNPPDINEKISLDEALTDLLQSLSLRDAAREAAELSGTSRKEAYARGLEISRDRKAEDE